VVLLCDETSLQFTFSIVDLDDLGHDQHVRPNCAFANSMFEVVRVHVGAVYVNVPLVVLELVVVLVDDVVQHRCGSYSLLQCCGFVAAQILVHVHFPLLLLQL
jgi:hypothetical protein